MLTDGALQDVKALAPDGDDQEAVTERLPGGREPAPRQNAAGQTGPVAVLQTYLLYILREKLNKK